MAETEGFRVPMIDSCTKSDSGAWRTLFDLDTDTPHVVPRFGPKHELTMLCWCHPVVDQDYSEPAISHNVAQ